VPGEPSGGALKRHWFHILLALAEHDLHGLEIMEEVSRRTEGEVHLWPGMLYGSLKRMLRDGLVDEAEPPADSRAGGGRPRYYALTARGREVLRAEVRRLSAYLEVARERGLLQGGDA